MDEPLGYSIPVACRMLGGISRQTIYRRVADDTLELVKVGNRSLITLRSIKALLPEQRAGE